MNNPKLDKSKCSLLIAEYATGHIFKKDLTIFLKGQDESEVFQVFDNFEVALEFAQTFIKIRPEFECSIYNNKGEYLTTLDLTGERKYLNNE